MNIPHEHLDEALTAMRADSQKGIFGARGCDENLISQETFDKCDRVFREVNSSLRTTMSLDELRKIVY